MASRGGVLVTGASTGIGHATALHLDRLGYRVFAGVRGEQDAQRLTDAASDRLRVIQPLDVTDADAIAAAAKTVEDELQGEPLKGIVNNAGVGVGGPLEAVDLDDFRRSLEVNTVAPLAVAQAFLPQLRRSKGRIVNMSSIGGRVPQPLVGPYVTSKFALEAVTATLRTELLEWGIEVVAIEPGTISTPIWQKSSDQVDTELERMSPEHRALYEKRIEKARKVLARQDKRGAPPEKVAEAVEKALTAKRPKPRYLVGDAYVLLALHTLLPTRVWDRVLARLSG